MMSLHKFIKSCNKCILHHNQCPVLQPCDNAEVFWVGLSAVKVSNSNEIPLSESTNSGKLIHSIEALSDDATYYKTNIVKCLPLKNGKIRYPSKKEMEKCFFHFENELDILKPELVFLLGKQVATFVLSRYGIKEYNLNDDFDYKVFQVGNFNFIPVHHPSYILIYKRKRMQDYIKKIERIIRLNIHHDEEEAMDSILQKEYSLAGNQSI